MTWTLVLGIGAPVTASGAISMPTPVGRAEPALPAHFPPSEALVSTIPLAGVCRAAPRDTTTDRFTFEADGSWTLEWFAGPVTLDTITVFDSEGVVVSDAALGAVQAGSIDARGSGRFTVRFSPPGCHRFVVTATREMWRPRA
jgi:hypothetical protein